MTVEPPEQARAESPVVTPRALARAWALGLVLVVPGLVLAELAMRFFVASPRTMIPDEELGSRQVPNARMVFSEEGYSRSWTNEQGLLDAAPADEPPGPVVLALGDSYTQARHVAIEERFTELLEGRLGASVINAGHASWTVGHHVSFTRRRCATFAPAAVLLQINDGDAFELEGGAFEIAPENGGYAVRARPVRRSSLAQLAEAISMRSALFNAVQARGSLLLSRQLGGGAAGAADDAADREAPADLEARLAFAIGELAECAPVVVLYVPRLEYDRASCTREGPELAPRFARAAEDARAAFVDVGDGLCAAYRRAGQPPNGFHNARMGEGHLNPRGHQVVARALTPVLARALGARP